MRALFKASKSWFLPTVFSLVSLTSLGICIVMPAHGQTAPQYSLSNLRGGDTPVMVRGDAYANYNYDPSVIYDNGTYRAYWCGAYIGHVGDNILYAESASLAGPWHAHGSSAPNSYNDVFFSTGNYNNFDGLHVCDPSIIKVDSVYYMYYTGAHSPGANGPGAIGVASSVDGLTWTRLNNGNPIVSTVNQVPGDGYGVGEPTVTHVGTTYYMMYNDHTSAAAYSNGAGEFLISASDPLFQENAMAFNGAAFVPLTPATQTGFNFFNGNNTDLQYIDAWNEYLMLSHSDPAGTHAILLDQYFREVSDQFIAPTQWCDGPGIVSNPERHALMNTAGGATNVVSVDFLRAVGTCSNPLTYKLGWRGVDLTLGASQIATAAPVAPASTTAEPTQSAAGSPAGTTGLTAAAQRDAQRINDMQNVAAALERYKAASGGRYYPRTIPPSTTYRTVCTNGYNKTAYTTSGPSGYIPNLAPQYMAVLPTDPRACQDDGSFHGYLFESDGYSYKFMIDTAAETGCGPNNEYVDPARAQYNSPGHYFCAIYSPGGRNW